MNSSIFFDIKKIKDLENGNMYQISINFPMEIGFIEDVNFVIENSSDSNFFKLSHIKNEDGKVFFNSEIFLETKAIYHYYFSYFVNGNHFFHKKENITHSDNIIKPEMFKMSVNFSSPRWAKGKIMYHIFVDRYRRGSANTMKEMPRRVIHNSWDEQMIIGPDSEGVWNNDFYGGDLKGITDSLDYIKSLGVSILYLSPIVYSQSNHRYDTSDYENVDPYVGVNSDLAKLCNEAHKKGMKVILDAVFNHTGNDSKYFNELGTFDSVGAYQNNNSPYSSFYKKHVENNKVYYDYWWGMTNLPVCDGYSKTWQEYITGENGIIDKWFNLGIDGLRLDVADELTDSFIEKIRMAVKRNKEDGFILGEVWKNPMRMNRGYIESGKGMDSVMNYPLIDALIRYFKYADTFKLSYIINDIKNEYPTDTINTLMNFTSTHDISRPINIFATNDFDYYGEWAWNLNKNDLEFCKNLKLSNKEYERGKEIYKAYVFALTFMPGILSIFYGDEVGLQGIGNLANRKPYPWGFRDKDLLEYFRTIGKIRQSEKFLEKADFSIIDINPNYFMFERSLEDEKALIVVNRTDEERKISIPLEYENSDKVYTLKKVYSNHLSAYGAISYKKNVK